MVTVDRSVTDALTLTAVEEQRKHVEVAEPLAKVVGKLQPGTRIYRAEGDDEAYGLDVDARWQPKDALTLTATLERIDATYKKYITPPPETLDLSGEPTGEPKLSAALGVS